MTLKSLFDELRKSLAHPAAVRVFAAAAPRHLPLACYESPLTALDSLHTSSPLTVEERDAILVALLGELRTTKAPVWQTLLLLAFEPMLAGVRARLGQPAVTRFGRSHADDLDQRVLSAFLEAARSLRITSHAARALRLAVRRSVFEQERGERAAFQPEEFDDEAYDGKPFETATSDKAAANEIAGIVGAEGGEELRDMILATRAHGEALRAYVARRYPDLSLPRRRTIERRLTAAANRLERALRKRAQRPVLRRDTQAA